uniref:Odorant receptor n=1 Tax=Adelphocoris lineolatus TaxID=236346 RepID=A0A2I4PH60_ADELI|nr:olfactory receptor 53 [Adelphocoris lineolatus]
MAEGEAYFDYMVQILKNYNLWYGYSTASIQGIILTMYSVLQIFLMLGLLSAAISQTYFYGMSYIVHDSAVFLPIGFMGLVIIIYMALNYSAIMKTASKFELFLNSFTVDWEEELIKNHMKDTRTVVTLMVNVISFYVLSTGAMHFNSISLHYFFGIFSKPVLLPLVLEKFMEGNFQLRPMFFVHVLLSLLYIKIAASIITVIALNIHFSGSAVGALQVLIKRLENVSKKTADGCHKLAADSDLRDTIQKHVELLNIVSDMMEWNGFIVSFTLTSCSILFCINAITVKKSIETKEYSSTCVWGSFLLVALAIGGTMCSRGQEIEKMSEELLRAMYNLPWYRESSKSRRNIVLMIAQGNRLISLDYKGLMRVNMVTYSEMVQKAYSYFMILGSVE